MAVIIKNAWIIDTTSQMTPGNVQNCSDRICWQKPAFAMSRFSWLKQLSAHKSLPAMQELENMLLGQKKTDLVKLGRNLYSCKASGN